MKRKPLKKSLNIVVRLSVLGTCGRPSYFSALNSFILVIFKNFLNTKLNQ